jgi:molecular chaperone GrpE
MSENENTSTEKIIQGEAEGQDQSHENAKNAEPVFEQVEADSPDESSNTVIANLEEEINKLKMENTSLKDSWARERAEFQNFKRRTAAEYLNVKREALKNFVSKILNPIDNMERVGQGMNLTDEVKPFVDGVSMIRNEFYNILERENIIKLSPKGEPFDPTTMEAIAAEESDQYSEETVIEVYQAGYQFVENNERFTLRPARVRVGRPKN